MEKSPKKCPALKSVWVFSDLEIFPGGGLTWTVGGGRGLEVGEGGGEERIVSTSHCSLPGNLGSGAGDGEPRSQTSSTVVLLVDLGRGLPGHLVGLPGQQGGEVGLHQLAAAVQLAVRGQQAQGRLGRPQGGRGQPGGEAAGDESQSNNTNLKTRAGITMVREEGGGPVRLTNIEIGFISVGKPLAD